MNRRRPQSAAIFDLDRTLIAGPSGPAFASHLGAAGIHQRSLPGADLEDTRRAAERCMQIIADAKIEHRASATSAWLTISIGAASQVAAAGTDGSALVETADAALYRAKRCGRGRIEF